MKRTKRGGPQPEYLKLVASDGEPVEPAVAADSSEVSEVDDGDDRLLRLKWELERIVWALEDHADLVFDEIARRRAAEKRSGISLKLDDGDEGADNDSGEKIRH